MFAILHALGMFVADLFKSRTRVGSENSIHWIRDRQQIRTYCWMFAIASLFVRVLCDGFKSRRRLEAEIVVLRHQLNVLQQRAPRRLYLTWADRALFVRLYRGFPRILDAITIIRPRRSCVGIAKTSVRSGDGNPAVLSENSIRPGFASEGRIIASLRAMFAILHALGMFVVDLFKSPRRLEAENLFLRHQLTIALRRAPPRLRLRGSDRALLIWMTRLWPSLLGVAQVVQPETILRWHRAGFTAFWRWKSRNRAGRPKIDRELRDLIRRMSKENPMWGASRIHGELLMLGFEVAQSTVSKYMVRGRSRRRKPGRHFFATTRRRSRPLICVWFRR